MYKLNWIKLNMYELNWINILHYYLKIERYHLNIKLSSSINSKYILTQQMKLWMKSNVKWIKLREKEVELLRDSELTV